jgi:hypothetical protein
MTASRDAVTAGRAAVSGAVLAAALLAGALAWAHVNPSLVLVGDRDAMSAALPGAAQFADLDLKLTDAQKKALHDEWGFKPAEGGYRVYEGRDAGSHVLGCVVFLVQATIHSPVRVAVGVGTDGKVAGAAVVEVSEESYPWVKPLLERRILKHCVGQDAHGDFSVPADAAQGPQATMQAFYAKVILRMVHWAAALGEAAGLTGTK